MKEAEKTNTGEQLELRGSALRMQRFLLYIPEGDVRFYHTG